MKPRALICDVYNTILRVGPPPPDAAQRWEQLWRSIFNSPPPLNLLQISLAASDSIAASHQRARQMGIAYPEVCWPAILQSALPDLAHLTAARLDQFVFDHMQLGRTLQLMPGAAETLLHCHRSGLLLGIASNAQSYTLRELRDLLAPAGVSSAIFNPQLCAWSFELGFSKPNPHFFRTLSARLEALGIPPRETLMAGDRLDNDIQPAQAQGWLTWLLGPKPSGRTSAAGSWLDLAQALAKYP